MPKLIVLRHGQSQWNLENRFTGWFDVDLTEDGRKEAIAAAKKIADANISSIDLAYTSYLKRAIRTLWTVLDELDRMWIDVHKNWELNERHYGALQGLNKAETMEKYGEEQVHIWRRSYETPPAPLDKQSPMYPANDPKYKNISIDLLPTTESLTHVRSRVVDFWHSNIAPQIIQGKQVIITAHGNSLRALSMYLMDMTPEQVMEFNIPTASPLIFELDDKAKAKDMYFL